MSVILSCILTFLRDVLKLPGIPTQTIHSASQSIATSVAVKQQTQLQNSRRNEEMSCDGTAWEEWSDAEAALEVTGSHVIVMRGSTARTSFIGPLRIELGEDRLTMFDFRIFLGERQRTLAPILQTVISYEPQNLNCPHFFLRPVVNDSAVRTEFLGCYDNVDSMPAYAHNLIAESVLPGPAAAFFETKAAFQQLLPFIQENGFTVEWTGNRLLVYRLQETVDREGSKQFAQDVVHLSQLLQLASTAYSEALDERIAVGTERIGAVAESSRV